MITAYSGALNYGSKSKGLVFSQEMYWETTRNDTIYLAELAAISDFILNTIVDLNKTDQTMHFITSNPVIQSHLTRQSMPNKEAGIRLYKQIMRWCDKYRLELEVERVKSYYNTAHKRLKTNRYLSLKSERANQKVE